MEAGLDSLGAVELRNSLANRFNIEFPATLTFDHPTIAALAAFIASRAPAAAENPLPIVQPASQQGLLAKGRRTAVIGSSCR